MKNIFVGNLGVEATEELVRQLFQAYGIVQTVTLVKDRDTGFARGFAFVEMADDAEANSAIAALNGTLLRERQLTVNEARPKHADANGSAPPEKRSSQREPLPTRKHRQHRY